MIKILKHNIDSLFTIALLILALFVTGLELNTLYTELMLRTMESSGINYDAFRELKITQETLNSVNAKTTNLMQHYPYLQTVSGVDTIGYLTFCMLANSFDLTKETLVDELIYLKGIGRITPLQGYQRLCRYYKAILGDLEYFPVPKVNLEVTDISYDCTWSDLRSYGGNRKHEGTDIMATNNTRGYFPIISITDGIVEKLGWLEQGGYRIGIRSPSGGYFYYAHLASYAPELKQGDVVLAGQLLGFMGDSGYGKEGTIGKFDVHLHLGIYVETSAGEMSVNPYWILKMLENERTSLAGYRSD